MEYVFIARKDDAETFNKFYKSLEGLPNETILDQYNKQVEIGIVGVHAQALKLLALRKVFLERFGESPIHLEDDVIISLTGMRTTLPSY